MRLGIVGFGSFGSFIASSIGGYFSTVSIYDNKELDDEGSGKITYYTDFEDFIETVDIIILAIPVGQFSAILEQIVEYLDADEERGVLVVDVASVKQRSEELMQKYLDGRCSYVCCHPLFGPQSAAGGLAGHTMVVTSTSNDSSTQRFMQSISLSGLVIENMTAEEHDRQMAYSHALTFSIAGALSVMNLEDVEVVTPSFKKLLDIVEIDKNHSDELMQTIIGSNNFSENILKEFNEAMKKVAVNALDNEAD